MILYVILFILGLLTGYVIRPLFTRHKHDYEVLWHSTFEKVSFPLVYSVSELEKMAGYGPTKSDISVTYKRCTKCKNCDIRVSITGRERISFDFDLAKSTLDKHIASIKEKEDQDLFDSLNKRIGLTSPEVPYNPAHAKQTTPQ
jgi:hypothetical protein